MEIQYKDIKAGVFDIKPNMRDCVGFIGEEALDGNDAHLYAWLDGDTFAKTVERHDVNDKYFDKVGRQWAEVKFIPATAVYIGYYANPVDVQ